MKFLAMSDLDHMFSINASNYEVALEKVKRLFRMENPKREIFVTEEDAWTEVRYLDDEDQNLTVYLFDPRVFVNAAFLLPQAACGSILCCTLI